MRPPDDAMREKSRQVDHAVRPVILRGRTATGTWVVVGLLAGFFVWAALVPLSKGVVAPGTVVVDSKRKTIQHFDGGVIRAIHVQDGMRVEHGGILLELDDTKARATRDMVRARYLNKLAMLDRLSALAVGKLQVVFSEPLLAAKEEHAVIELMQLEQIMFRALRMEHEGRVAISAQRIVQLEQKMRGLAANQDALRMRADLLKKEVHRLELLQEKKLIEAAAVTERLQQLYQLNGDIGQTAASISEAQVAIGEARLALMQIDREWQQDLAQQVSTGRESMNEALSELKVAQSVMDRTVITAPINGTVLALKATTVGGVLSAGAPVMDIVPEDDALVIDAHVRPLDVDSVHQGMAARVKFSAFRTKTTPALVGMIANISADVLSEPNKGEPYYLMRVTVSGEEMRRLGNLSIVPGMPVEIFTDGGERTLLQYLADPITSLGQRSLREE